MLTSSLGRTSRCKLYLIQHRTYINKKNKTTRQNKRRKRKEQGKHTQVRQNASGRLWSYHNLNMDFDRKFYLPFMNMIRAEGYWTPYWLDLHPDAKCETAPEEIHDPQLYNLSEWNNEQGFNDPNIFKLSERSRPHNREPGTWGPPPATPPKILRMEPPKPNESDLNEIAKIKQTMSAHRFYRPHESGKGYNMRKMLR